jgi:putative chitinase
MSFEFDFTEEKLAKIIPNAAYGVNVWFNELTELLPVFEITTVGRVAAFIAQTAHESGGYRALAENLNYSADGLNKIFPKYFANAGRDANQYARQPEKIANVVYANRMGNGTTESGDGWRYCGRGLLQLTGKQNYSNFAQYAGIAVEEAPGYIETPRGAVHSACWFWFSNDLNTFADAGDFVGMTKRINGGTIGLDDRIKHYNEAVHIFGA